LKAIAHHTSRKKEKAIYYPCKVCNNNNVVYRFKECEHIHEHFVRSGFMDNYLMWTKHGETRPRIENYVDERAEENLIVPDHVYTHHDNGGYDDANHSDEGLDVVG
jgi:hypothetical protein